MSTLKNLYFDLVPFAYHAAFYEGLKKELKKICQRMLESREYEKMLAIACEYAERIGSMEEALQLLGIKEELPELLERDWDQQTAIGTAVQSVYEDGALDGAEYACCMAMYACESVRNLVSLEAHASLDKSSICRNLLSILGIFCCRIFLLLLV